MSKWSEYYQKRVGRRYTNYCALRYQPFIEEILNQSAFHIREEGCGIGTISKILNEATGTRHFEMMDNDDDQLSLALENTDFKVNYYKGDILEPQKHCDLIHSHGVLEHFEPLVIAYILSRQKNEAGTVIHYVPTDKYDTPSFGDEMLKSAKWWINTYKPTSYKLFNENKDLVLIWKT